MGADGEFWLDGVLFSRLPSRLAAGIIPAMNRRFFLNSRPAGAVP